MGLSPAGSSPGSTSAASGCAETAKGTSGGTPSGVMTPSRCRPTRASGATARSMPSRFVVGLLGRDDRRVQARLDEDDPGRLPDARPGQGHAELRPPRGPAWRGGIEGGVADEHGLGGRGGLGDGACGHRQPTRRGVVDGQRAVVPPDRDPAPVGADRERLRPVGPAGDRGQGLQRGEVPDLHVLVLAAGDERLAVRGHQAEHGGRMREDRVDERGLGPVDLPGPDRAVDAPGQDGLPPRAEGDRVELGGRVREGPQALAGGEIPELDGPIGPRRGERLAVGRERHGVHRVGVILQGESLLTPGDIPHDEGSIVAGGGQRLAIRGQVGGEDRVAMAPQVVPARSPWRGPRP